MGALSLSAILRAEVFAILSEKPGAIDATDRLEPEERYAVWFIETQLLGKPESSAPEGIVAPGAANRPFVRQDEITDWPGLAKKLRDSATPPVRAIRDALLALTSQRLEFRFLDEESKAAFVDALNGLLVFDQFPLKIEMLGSDSTQTFVLSRFAKRIPIVWQNRFLLEAALPEHIRPAWDDVRALFSWLHEHPRNALCLSGGGIRSATFNLGVIQGLVRKGVFQEFDYLSTVSGGGYIGAWLSAWCAREGYSGVLNAINKRRHSGSPEPQQVQHLRQYSNYLTPKLGVTSADTWTLIGTYLRNLLLNWAIFIPALATILIVPRLSVALLQIPALPWVAEGCLGAAVLLWVVGICFCSWQRPSSASRVALGQSGFLWGCLIPIYLAANLSAAVWAWRDAFATTPFSLLSTAIAPGLPLFVTFGVGVHVAAWAVYNSTVRSPRMKRALLMELLACAASGGLGGWLLGLGASWTSNGFTEAPGVEIYVSFAAPYVLASFLLAAVLYVGLVSRKMADSDREWLARMGAWVLIAIVAKALFSAIVLFGPSLITSLPRLFSAVGGASALVTLVLTHSAKTPASPKEAGQADRYSVWSQAALAAAGPLFIIVFLAAISLLTTSVIPPLMRKLRSSEEFLMNSPSFQPGEIRDLSAFVAQLKSPPDGATTNLWNRLSLELRKRIESCSACLAERGPEAEGLRAALALEITRIIRNPELTVLRPSPGGNQTETVVAREQSAQRIAQRNKLALTKASPEGLQIASFSPLMIVHGTSPAAVIILALIFGAGWALTSNRINLNRFSLHGVYRDRLTRAYLGASNPTRHPNPFSGFDPADNVFLAELRHRPFHIVNMALNLVAGENLAWQQRKAESFTASPLHAGNSRLGYRPIVEYASKGPDLGAAPGTASDRKRGLSLGTAVTISGAAASPNMGYHSSSVFAIIMTLFNVRLGAWLGNPGSAGAATYKDSAPRSAFLHVVYEALGLTDDNAEYVYLSDGGHFENLGLYEMVLRRTHIVVVSDAGCDPDCALEDLGNAIRKIRVDLGIPISLQSFSIFPRKKNEESKYCAIGVIDYQAVDGPGVRNGHLVYIKPAISGNEPKDVYNYKETSHLFPHEPTSDQWFTESQFESYRALGEHVIETLCKGAGGEWSLSARVEPLQKFRKQVGDYLASMKKNTS